MQVAIYARKSTESEDRQVQSLEDQLTALRDLAKRQGILVAHEYIEARSAKEPGTRPEFEALLSKIRAGFVEGVLTWQINRLSRNMVDGGQVAHLLHSGKLKWIKTPDREFRPEDSALLLAIETGVATSFIQDLSRNVKRGLAGKANRGWHPGKARLGYINNLLTHEIEIDPDRFFIVQQGWEMLASGGYTVADVFRMFRDKGMTGTDSGKPISISRVYALFQSEFYLGKFRFNGKLMDGKHPAMVNLDTFNRVQALFQRISKQRDPKQKHPYAGVFRCPTCGCQITAETKVKSYKGTNRQVSYTYYRCTGARGCRGGAVRSESLDSALERFADKIAMHPSIRQWVERCLAENLADSATQIEATQASMDRRVKEIERRLERIRDMRIDEELTQEEYLAQKADLNFQLETLQAEVARHGSLAAKIEHSIEEKLDLLEKATSWREMAVAARRGYLRHLAKEAFLTLENLEFKVDSMLAKLAAIEPPIISSDKQKCPPLLVSIPAWQPIQEHIRTLATEQKGDQTESIIVPL